MTKRKGIRLLAALALCFTLAVWDGRPSGTGKTVQYAQRQGKLVTIINPRTMLVE